MKTVDTETDRQTCTSSSEFLDLINQTSSYHISSPLSTCRTSNYHRSLFLVPTTFSFFTQDISSSTSPPRHTWSPITLTKCHILIHSRTEPIPSPIKSNQLHPGANILYLRRNPYIKPHITTHPPLPLSTIPTIPHHPSSRSQYQNDSPNPYPPNSPATPCHGSLLIRDNLIRLQKCLLRRRHVLRRD